MATTAPPERRGDPGRHRGQEGIPTGSPEIYCGDCQWNHDLAETQHGPSGHEKVEMKILLLAIKYSDLLKKLNEALCTGSGTIKGVCVGRKIYNITITEIL